MACSGSEDGYLEEAASGNGHLDTAIRSGMPCVIGDIESDPGFARWRGPAAERDYQSVVSVPIYYDEGAMPGYLIIYSGRKNAFGKEQMEFLSQIAEDIAIGIKSLRLERELETKHQELQKAYAELKSSEEIIIQQEKLASLGQLAAGIAHEIKNPLAVILQGTEYMSSSVSDELLIDVAGRIKNSALRADNIIKGLLRFARPTELNVQSADLGALIDEAVSLVDHQLNKKSIKVSRHYSGILNADIDIDQIRQVFINILANSIDAMDERGRIDIYLEPVTVRDGSRRVRIKFADTGKGIEPEHLKRIFDPFFTTKRKTGGTGLGLAITKGIIEKHKGDIAIESQVGTGTAMVISFPLFDN